MDCSSIKQIIRSNGLIHSQECKMCTPREVQTKDKHLPQSYVHYLLDNIYHNFLSRSLFMIYLFILMNGCRVFEMVINFLVTFNTSTGRLEMQFLLLQHLHWEGNSRKQWRGRGPSCEEVVVMECSVQKMKVIGLYVLADATHEELEIFWDSFVYSVSRKTEKAQHFTLA